FHSASLSKSFIITTVVVIGVCYRDFGNFDMFCIVVFGFAQINVLNHSDVNFFPFSIC
ncbi:16484_t:CDS:1, partial [Racocetra persica]